MPQLLVQPHSQGVLTFIAHDDVSCAPTSKAENQQSEKNKMRKSKNYCLLLRFAPGAWKGSSSQI